MDFGRKKEQLIWIIIFGISAILLFIRCFYGIGISFSDEFSQPAVLKRFMYGDRLLIDDWQPATTLLGYLMYCVTFFIPNISFSIIHMRIFYVLYQLIVTTLFVLIAGWDRQSTKVCALAYMFSTPYGIMSICYNSVAISSFILFLAFMLSDFKPWKRICGGCLLAVAVLAIPHVAIVFMVYAIAVFSLHVFHKKFEPFEIKDLLWMLVGIAVLFLPFCIILVSQGSISEYYTNLQYIFGDVEHTEYSIPAKLVRSHYQLIRVYWRSWLPLLIICITGYFTKSKTNVRKCIYALSCLVSVYTTLRFAFVYGSISINLMIVPTFFWGVSTVCLMLIYGKKISSVRAEIIWMIAGYIFAICDYLATNTEMLSMSAMFIVGVIGAISINVKAVSDHSLDYKVFLHITCSVFVICLAILRMMFIWGDSSIDNLNERIESGIAKGIYTTHDNAEDYYKIQSIITGAGIDKDDNTLIVPINPLYYISCDGAVASPYVFRFDTKLSELQDYYDIHEYKRPTKVVILELEDSWDIVDYFVQNGYDFIVQEDNYCVMSK